MRTLEQLESFIGQGQAVLIAGENVSSVERLREVYPSAKEAYEAAQKPASPVQAPATGPKVEVNGDVATVDGKEYVTREAADAALQAYQSRNHDQAALIDALTKDPKDLERLDKGALSAVGKFEGAEFDGRANAETILAAILKKRG